MLKTINAKCINYVSPFGEHAFINVPVVVDVAIDVKQFNFETDEYALSAEVIDVMERQMATRWLHEYMAKDADGNHLRRGILIPNEVLGIMTFLNVNGSEFTELLGYQSRGTLSKILGGEKPMGPTAVNGAILLLLEELKTKGFARKLLRGDIAHMSHKNMKPNDDIGQLLRA